MKVAQCTVASAVDQVANGLGPGESRQALLELAGELTATAALVRKAARLDVGERRVLARKLAGLGYTTKQVADQCGVSDVTVRHYLRGRRRTATS